MSRFTPYTGPAQVGHIAVLNQPEFEQSKGYCVVIVGAGRGFVDVKYLDSHEDDQAISLLLSHVILTGKTPEWFCESYKPSYMALAEALIEERSSVDFTKLKGGGKRKAKVAVDVVNKLKGMTEQKQAGLRAAVLGYLKGDKQ